MGEYEEGERPRGAHFAPKGAEHAPARTSVVFPGASARPDETAVFLRAAAESVAAKAVSSEPASALAPASSEPASASAAAPEPVSEPSPAIPAADVDDDDMSTSDYEQAGRSAGMMTALILVSRLTGFVRTWAMGAALGLSLLSSSYQIAYNLPSMLYELVIGGMLITAFLPVYMEVRRERGKEASNEYVGNLLGILLLVLGVASLAATIGAPAVIWTQSFMSSGTGEMDTAVYLFRFFAVEILFFGLGSVFSGVLNAHRDYFWSNFAPVLNNVVVIASFAAFYVMDEVLHVDQAVSITVLAVGTTLGVFIQMACQIPALKRHGVRPRLYVNFRDPNLRKTLALGVPTLAATVCVFITASVQNAAALAVQPETGASVIAYSRLWYTLPYALLAVPITTSLYTEISRDALRGDRPAVRSGVARGMAQMCFFLVPFMFYLIVFSFPLNMIYCVGRFDIAGVEQVSQFLCFLAPALPLYGICMLLQKSCSALMNMKPYALLVVFGAVAEVAVALIGGVALGGGMPVISLSLAVSYLVTDVGGLLWLRRQLGGLGIRAMARGVAFGIVLGAAGALAGWGVLHGLEAVFGQVVTQVGDQMVAAPVIKTVGYVAVSGIVSLLVTFGAGVALKLPEVNMISSVVSRFTHRA